MKGMLIIILFSLLPLNVAAQNGNVKLHKHDSLRTGFLRYYVSKLDGHHGIELWKTKKDKNPIRYPLTGIYEYAIKKDTFRILQNFTPYFGSSARLELVEAKLLSSGKVSLFIVKNFTNPKRISTYTGGGAIPLLIDELTDNLNYIYFLEETESGYFRALPSKKDQLEETLLTFFPEVYAINSRISTTRLKYKAIPRLIKTYNAQLDIFKTNE